MMAVIDQTPLKTVYGSLPDQISGWEKSPAARVYLPDNLFEYINGNAELFISYDFRSLITFAYTGSGSKEITVDIFDMGDPSNAYGVFAHSRETEDRFVSDEIGSEYGGGLLTFWKGPFYISVLAFPETEESKETVRTIARAVSKEIPGMSGKPPILSRLPVEDLAPFSVRYFYHHIWLNTHFFISGENILNLGRETPAVLAKYYPDSNTPVLLLLVDYPDMNKARIAYQHFRENFLPGPENKIVPLPGGRWGGCEQNGRVLAVVLNAPDSGYAASLLSKIKFDQEK